MDKGLVSGQAAEVASTAAPQAEHLEPAMAQLSLTLLGGFEARLDGRPMALTMRKSWALLAYLALPAGRVHPRDALGTLLWGDVREPQARASLRQALFRLRQALGDGADLLRQDGDSVSLAGDGVETDVAQLERDLVHGGEDALSRAATLYRGDLLLGLVVNAPLFEEWLLPERERVRELALEGLARLVARQRDGGRLEAALQTALRLLALDPVQEAAHRTVMRLNLQLGRRGAGLRQYRACLEVLRHELEAEPEPQTRALYEALLRSEAPRRPGHESEPVAASPADAEPPLEAGLVGRVTEMAKLRQHLDQAWVGRGRPVVLIGEEGIGKTRLARAIAVEARTRGGRICWGNAHETGRIVPFAPWLEALRTGGVLDDPGILAGLDPRWRRELARLGLDPNHPADDLIAATSVTRLFEAVTQLVRHVASRQPLLVVLEDLHWADGATVALSDFVGRRLDDAPVLLVVTVRDEALPDAAMLDRALRDLDREHVAETVHLGPLSRVDTLELVRARSRRGSDEEAIRALSEDIWRASEGSPFVIVESIRVLQDSAAPRGGPPVLAARVREAIAERLKRLGDRARRLADVAAVMARAVDFRVLARASDLGELDAAEGIEELVRRRVLEERGEGFAFSHDRIRTVALASLSPPRRRALHRMVAASLEALNSGDALEPFEADLAEHCREAEEWDRAVRYLGRVARRATRVYAFEEALAAVRSAQLLVGRLAPAEHDRPAVELVVLGAEACQYLGRFQEGHDLLEVAGDAARRLEDPALTASYHVWRATMLLHVGAFEAAVASAKAAIVAAGTAGDRAVTGKAYYVLAEIVRFQGRPRQAVEFGERAAELLQETGESFWLGETYSGLGGSYYYTGAFGRAIEAAARGRSIGEAIDDACLRSCTRRVAAIVHIDRGDVEDALVLCREALAFAHEPFSRAIAQGLLGYAHLEAGDAGAAIPLLRAGAEALAGFGAPALSGRYVALLGEAHLRAGRPVEARRLLLDGLERMEPDRHGLGISRARRALGHLALAEGTPEEARVRFEQAVAIAAANEARYEEARGRLDLAALLASTPDRERAAALAGQALAFFKEATARHWEARARALVESLDPAGSAV
jgi:DNA-binding SARP family transcriptional activator